MLLQMFVAAKQLQMFVAAKHTRARAHTHTHTHTHTNRQAVLSLVVEKDAQITISTGQMHCRLKKSSSNRLGRGSTEQSVVCNFFI